MSGDGNAIAERERSSMIGFTYMRLFERLRAWVAIKGRTEAAHEALAPMADDLDVVWMMSTKQGEGPPALLNAAIAQCPELWRHAVPDGYVIVKYQTLQTVCANAGMVGGGKWIVAEGINAVEAYADRARRRAGDKEMRDEGYSQPASS